MKSQRSLSSPLGVFLILVLHSSLLAEDPPPACLGGETFRVEIQVSLDGGASWTNGSDVIGFPGDVLDVSVRTRMTVTSGETQGWSFSLRHDPSDLESNGGYVTLTSVTTDGTGTATVKNGGPPDFDQTAIQSGFNGYTQGVVIDLSSAITLPPTTAFVTSMACYSITLPSEDFASAELPLQFTHDIGNPIIYSEIIQNGLSNIPCAKNLCLDILADSEEEPSPTYCAIASSSSSGQNTGGAAPQVGIAQQGGGGVAQQAGPLPPAAPGTDFRRGDADADGTLNITDPIFTVNHLFLGGPQPTCMDAADGDDDDRLTLTDVIFPLNYLFIGGPAPPDPGPMTCGPDPTEQGVLQLQCQEYTICDQTDTDGDGLTDFHEGQIFTNPLVADTDGDNFTDGQEDLPTGVPGCNGGALNIRVLGADPLMRDIFVEIDYMVMGVVAGRPGHSHQPLDAAIQRVVNAFNNHGVTLHVDTGVAPYNLGGGNALVHQLVLQQPGETLWESFENTKNMNFDPRRCDVFHYGIWAHDYDGSGTSGISQDIFTDDFIVSLGTVFWNENNWPDQEVLEAALFMHELGHNLNLRHGGNEDLNNKPHYRSVMTHRYGVEGRDTNCEVGGDADIDYSNEVLADLTETQLDESTGMCEGVDVDWNFNGVIDANTVSANINCRARPDLYGPCPQDAVLVTANPQHGWDDWGGGTMRLDFQNSPNRLFGVPGPPGGGAAGGIPDELRCPGPP